MIKNKEVSKQDIIKNRFLESISIFNKIPINELKTVKSFIYGFEVGELKRHEITIKHTILEILYSKGL